MFPGVDTDKTNSGSWQILALRRLRQNCIEFKSTLSYIVNSKTSWATMWDCLNKIKRSLVDLLMSAMRSYKNDYYIVIYFFQLKMGTIFQKGNHLVKIHKPISASQQLGLCGTVMYHNSVLSFRVLGKYKRNTPSPQASPSLPPQKNSTKLREVVSICSTHI